MNDIKKMTADSSMPSSFYLKYKDNYDFDFTFFLIFKYPSYPKAITKML